MTAGNQDIIQPELPLEFQEKKSLIFPDTFSELFFLIFPGILITHN